jgi:hypothetical protein
MASRAIQSCGRWVEAIPRLHHDRSGRVETKGCAFALKAVPAPA